MDIGKSLEYYLMTNIFYVLPTALAWVFFIEVFKQVLKNSGYLEKIAKYIESSFTANKSAVAVSAIIFLGLSYKTVFISTTSSVFDLILITSVGVISVVLYFVTRRSRRIAGVLSTATWYEAALTTWLMMLFALVVVIMVLGLIRRLSVNLPA